MRHIIGIDGGGTHSTARLRALDSQRELQVGTGSINICSNERGAVRAQLRQAFTALWERGGTCARECAAVCVGSAGILSPASIALMREEVAALLCEDTPLRITDDMEICLAGALTGDCGVALLSGTGSFCIGKNAAGECLRTGGLGHILSDEGSAYCIGRAILIAAVRAFDGRGPSTALTRLLRERHGLRSIADIADYVYLGSGNKGDIATIAPLLEAACAEGDALALRILEQMAEQLVALVPPVRRHVGGANPEIALCGGVLANNGPLRERTAALLRETFPGARVHPANADACQGALRLARQLLES